MSGYNDNFFATLTEKPKGGDMKGDIRGLARS